jgi:DNA-directed RNA polymerase specialized sigma24 family protein
MWGEVEPELRRVLGRLVQPADVDDIVQEVFIRLAARCRRKPLPVEAVVDLAKLAGWNLGLNAVRDASLRALPRDRVPDLPDANDVEEQAVWHLDLDRVLAAVAEMPEADRAVIAEALSPTRARGATKREQDRTSLRLFRARNRLRARIAGVLSGFPALRWRLRLRPEVAQALGSFGSTVMMATMMGVLGGDVPPRPPAPVTVVVAEAAAEVVPPEAPQSPPVAHRATVQAGGPDRTPSTAPVTAVSSPPVPEEATPPVQTLVTVPRPTGGNDVATVGGRDRREDEPLVCAGGWPVTRAEDTICVDHPLR